MRSTLAIKLNDRSAAIAKFIDSLETGGANAHKFILLPTGCEPSFTKRREQLALGIVAYVNILWLAVDCMLMASPHFIE